MLRRQVENHWEGGQLNSIWRSRDPQNIQVFPFSIFTMRSDLQWYSLGKWVVSTYNRSKYILGYLSIINFGKYTFLIFHFFPSKFIQFINLLNSFKKKNSLERLVSAHNHILKKPLSYQTQNNTSNGKVQFKCTRISTFKCLFKK